MNDLQEHVVVKPKSRNRNRATLLFVGIATFLLGLIASTGLRYVVYKSDNVHYHANFAVYVNGKRDEFKSFTFYEEVNACSSDDKSNPKDRVHMHSENSGLIHVHAAGVAWSHFFSNIGYTLGDTVLKTDYGTYIKGVDGKKLTFMLNGKQVDTVADRRIVSEDRLLINYGDQDDQTLKKYYDTVPTDAHKANTEHDPAACSGGAELTPWQRLKKAIGA